MNESEGISSREIPIEIAGISDSNVLEINDHDPRDSAHLERTDGAGEPCPAPLMWQEIRDTYLRESRPWEIVRGPHRLVGRTWGDGPPLYFLNHFAATAELYSLVIWLLREQFRCVVFDTLTNDVRVARRSSPAISEYALDLFAIADQSGDNEFSVYGAGFGAAVGMTAVLDQPKRIHRMILQHGFASRPLSFAERALASFCWRSNRCLDQMPQRRRFQAVNHQPWFPPFDSSRFDFLVESTGTIALRDLARKAISINQFDVVSRLHEISCPTMILRTEGEGKATALGEEVLEAGLPNSRVEWMHSAGQHPCLTHPHRVVKIVQPFLLENSMDMASMANQ